MPASIIKAHIRQLAGSGNMLKNVIAERSIEAPNMEYRADYTPPAQHIIVAPTSSQTLLEWNKEGSHRRMKKIFTPGDLILNPNGCFTRPQWDRETRFTLMAIQPTGLAEVCDELEIANVDVAMKFHFRNGALSRAVQSLISCFETDPPSLLRARELELTVMRKLIQECRTLPQDLHRLSKRKLETVKELIRSKLSETITVEELAACAEYSPSRFLVLFRNATGFSPHQYIMRERLEEARILLTRTRMPLSRIALDCGFSDQSHLVRLFKRHTGITPGNVRKGS